MPVNNGNNDKYLDKKGLSYLWTKIKNMFALKSHTHSISQVSGLQTELNGKVDFINNNDAQIASKKSLYVQGVVSAQLIAGTTDSTSTAVIVGSSSSNMKGAYVKPYGKSSYYEILDASNYKNYIYTKAEVDNKLNQKMYYDKNAETAVFEKNGSTDTLYVLKRNKLSEGMGFTVNVYGVGWKEFRLPTDTTGNSILAVESNTIVRKNEVTDSDDNYMGECSVRPSTNGGNHILLNLKGINGGSECQFKLDSGGGVSFRYGYVGVPQSDFIRLASEDYVNNRMRSLNSLSTLNKMSVNNDEVEALNAKITALEKRIADLEAKLTT